MLKKVLLVVLVLAVISALISRGSDVGGEPTVGATAAGEPSPSTESAPPVPVSQWSLHEGKNEMDGSTTISVGLDATGDIEGWLSKTTPRLIIRCQEKKTDLFVVTGTKAQPELGEYERATVRLRYGDGQPISQMWSESTDGEALFAGSPIPVARRLVGVDTLRFQFTPFNANPAVATFVVTGLREHLERIATACGWSLGAE